MKSIWKYWIVLLWFAGCGVQEPVSQDKTLSSGSPQEKNAVMEVKRLAIQHGYHPEEMNLEIKTNFETGDIMIFLFPKPVDAQHLRREMGLFAIVNAKSGRVIRFNDPKTDLEK